MKNRPADLSLLEQHLFDQNIRLIEASDSLDRFCKAVPSAVLHAERQAAERNAAFKWATVGVLACAVLFGGAGYMIRWAADAVSLSRAHDLINEATAKANAATADAAAVTATAESDTDQRVAAAIAAVEAKAAKNAKAAQKFYEADGAALAACKSEYLQSFVQDGVTYCTPIRPSTWDAIFGNYALPKWRTQ